jgi:hypothetical protein
MERAWLNEIRPVIANRTRVRQGPLADALSNLRTAVPAFDLVNFGTPEAALRWSSQPVRLSEPLGTAFWDFLTLPDAEVLDEQIVGFARRFGPLAWPDPLRVGQEPASTPEAPETQAPGERASAEPLAAWRMYARGLRALYDRFDPPPPAGASGDGREWTIAPIVIPLWLRKGAPPFSEEDMLTEAVIVGIDTPPGDVAPPDRLLEAALAIAGVGAAFPPSRPATTGELVYTIPAQATSTPEGLRVRQVRGLLPILTTSLAFAIQTQERPRCTWCGKPAAIRTRAPRKGQPWYGDHTACRTLARANTINRSEDKRAVRRKQHAEHDRAGGSSSAA